MRFAALAIAIAVSGCAYTSARFADGSRFFTQGDLEQVTMTSGNGSLSMGRVNHSTATALSTAAAASVARAGVEASGNGVVASALKWLSK